MPPTPSCEDGSPGNSSCATVTCSTEGSSHGLQASSGAPLQATAGLLGAVENNLEFQGRPSAGSERILWFARRPGALGKALEGVQH